MSSCFQRGTDCRLRGWLAVAGGFLVHLSLGTIYTIGNMVPYVTSYIRAFSHPENLTYTATTWIFASALIGQGVSMFIGGILEKKIGPRLTTLLGGWIMSVGVLLTSLTVKVSFYLTLLTYGLMFGIGVGLAYAPPLACAMKWLPNHKGLVNGVVVAGFGGGAFIFNQVQTAFINPQNKVADQEVDSEKYFSKENAADVLERVPHCFLLLGSCYVVMQFVGAMLLVDPHIKISETRPLFESHDEDDDASGEEEMGFPREDTVSEMPDMLPLAVLKTRSFYTLWGIFLVNGQAVVFISTLYKAYGQTFIYDDHFLAAVGAFASVFNSVGRVIWGHFADKTSFRLSMLILCSSMIILMLTLIGAQEAGKAMFFLWICLIFFTFSGNFVLLPTATAKCYGQKYVAINYGLVFTSQVVTGLIGAMLATLLVSRIGWFGMFCLVSSFSGIGWLLTFSFNQKQDGKDV